MGMFDSLFNSLNNEKTINFFLGKLTSHLKEKGISAIVITPPATDNDSPEITQYSEPIKILKEKDFQIFNKQLEFYKNEYFSNSNK